LGDENKPQFDFNGNGFEEKIDKQKHEALGLCPVCRSGQVYVMDRAYACENAIAEAKTCTFRMGKTILQREIPKEQAQKLIATGKTDLLPRFISKKGRPFSAYLKLDNGKVGFEFEEKKARPKRPVKRTVPAGI
jgi:DNA topoisomerase III